MFVNEAGYELIKHFESLHDGDESKLGLQPKMCPAGIWTVGYGHALRDANGAFLKGEKDKDKAYMHELSDLTVEQAERLLHRDIAEFEDYVKWLVKVPLTDNQFSALVSIMYNIGRGAFAKSTFLKRLNNKDYEGCAEAMLWWNKAGGKVLKGLVRRRNAEKDLFLKDH